MGKTAPLPSPPALRPKKIIYLDTKNKAAAKVASRVQFPTQPTKAAASGVILYRNPEKVNLRD